MATARRVRAKVTIYESELQKETAPGGSLAKHLAAVNRLAFRFAVAGAPSRTGVLKSRHVNAGVRKIGPYKAVGTVNNTAEHALWVHDGTGPRIYPVAHRNLRLPAGRLSTRMILRPSVAGQRANPWLYEAGVKAAAIMGGEVRRGRA